MESFKDKYPFPDVSMTDEDGLLAIGGDLNPERLLSAYECGIFPWYSESQPILWWSPDPRFILFPEQLVVSKSMKQFMRNTNFRCSFDEDFENVIQSCSKIPRKDQDGTWITDEMTKAYIQLHQLGYAHSVEVWSGTTLVGGLYGVSLGKCFFGESMFSKASNTSKMALITLVNVLSKKGFEFIDCQVHTDHLQSMGAELIPRAVFMDKLEEGLQAKSLVGSWKGFLQEC